MLRRLIRCTRGTSALEYAIIASIVSIAGIVAFVLVGEQSNRNMGNVSGAYAAASERPAPQA